MTRDALLAAVAADPDADLPRLVYADFLDEAGEADRAEFVRLQCQTARTGPTDPGWLPAKLREYELYENDTGFASVLEGDDCLGMTAYYWRRGFPDWVPAHRATRYGQNGCYHLDEHDAVFVREVDVGPTECDRLAEAGWLVSPLPGHHRRPPEAAPALGLSVGHPAVIPALAADWCRTARMIALGDRYWHPDPIAVDDFCQFLAGLPAGHWPALRRLELNDPLTSVGVRALTAAPACRGVTAFRLCLGGGDTVVRAADVERFAARFAPTVEALELSDVSAAQMAALARYRWPRLRRLALTRVRMGALAELLRADLPAVTDLTLGSSGGSAEPAMLGLAGVALAANLDRLALRGWPPAATLALLRHLSGDRLRSLDLRPLPAGPVRVAVLAGLPALRRLCAITLDTTPDLTRLADPDVLPELHSVRLGEPLVRPPGGLAWRGGERTLVVRDGDDQFRPTAFAWTAG